MFRVNGKSITDANAALQLNNNIKPTINSQSPKKGIKYPLAAIPAKNASAATPKAGEGIGKNFIAPKTAKPNPVKTLKIV